MWPLGVTALVFLSNVLISKNSIVAYLHSVTYNQINTFSLLWFSWRNNIKKLRLAKKNSKEDKYRQINGEYLRETLAGCACVLLNSSHTNTWRYLQPAGQQWVSVTWRKACVSVWSGAKWSWNWCCWSSSVPSGHGSLPRNDCTLHTHAQGKMLDLTNFYRHDTLRK